MKNFTTNLRQIITVQESILEDDGIGGKLEFWRDYIILSAEVKAINEYSLKEAFTSMQLMDKSLYRFRIRYNPKLKPSMRILYDERIFNIKRVVNHEEKNTITIMIAEEDAGDRHPWPLPHSRHPELDFSGRGIEEDSKVKP